MRFNNFRNFYTPITYFLFLVDEEVNTGMRLINLRQYLEINSGPVSAPCQEGGRGCAFEGSSGWLHVVSNVHKTSARAWYK